MGISVYICFVMVAVYSMLGIFIFFRRWRYIEGHKRISIFNPCFAIVLNVSPKNDVNWFANPKLLIEKNTPIFNLNIIFIIYQIDINNIIIFDNIVFSLLLNKLVNIVNNIDILIIYNKL